MKSLIKQVTAVKLHYYECIMILLQLLVGIMVHSVMPTELISLCTLDIGH